MAVLLRLVQRFQHSKKAEFMDLEKQFTELEHRGILPRGERFTPIAGREPANTVVWQCRFENLAAAEAAMKLFDSNPEHTALGKKQGPFFQDMWVELYQVLEF
jgi:hypothetical protein